MLMAMMHWAGFRKSKRTGRCRPGMGMMPLETGHGKKKAGKGRPEGLLISTMP